MCDLSDRENIIKFHVLIDRGATGYAFIDETFAHHHNLPLYLIKNPQIVEVIDSNPIASGLITHLAKVTLHIN